MAGKLIIVIMEGTSAKNASFGLSKALAERGHRIIYLAPEHDREHVERQGFGFYTIRFPYVPDVNQPGDTVMNPVSWVNKKALGVRRVVNDRVYFYHYAEKWLKQTRPDLVLLDNKLVRLAAPFMARKIPVINVNPNLSGFGFEGKPPVFSDLLPAKGTDVIARLKISMSWKKIIFAQLVREIQERLLFSLVLRTVKYQTTATQIRKMGVGLHRSEYGFRMTGPEIVMGPEVLDFPNRGNSAQRCYAGICVNESRKDAPFETALLNQSKPFLYCSLGTHSTNYKYTERLYRSLIDAMKQLTGYHLLLQAEGFEKQQYPGDIPENVSIFQSVPQLLLLKKAKLFITHGGFSSVREAVFYGVPMIVFPGWHDQPGNAARVRYHELGLQGNMKTVTTGKLVAMITYVLNNERILASVQKLQKLSQEKNEFQSAIKFIESFLVTQ